MIDCVMRLHRLQFVVFCGAFLCGCTRHSSTPESKPVVPVERFVEVNVKPRFRAMKSENGLVFDLLISGDRDASEAAWPRDAPSPESLDSSKMHNFQILETKTILGPAPDSTFYWPGEVIKVSQAEQVLYDASICAVHHQKMRREIVDINYGLPDSTSTFFEEMRTKFPNCGYALGGCSVDSLGNKVYRWFCEDCGRARREWEGSQK